MSKNNILAAFFALLVLGGCSDELTLSNRQPELIRFGTAMRMDPQTRTSYDVDNDGGTIYWEANDQIKIVAVNNRNNEFKESLFMVQPLADPTVGTIQKAEGDDLYWRPGDSFLFYGFYPTQLKAKFNFSTEKLEGLTVNAEQPTSVDMSAVYMVARTGSDYNEDPVSLYFHPLVTTVTLIVKNEMDTDGKNNVTISNLMLSSDEYSLAGSYKVGIGEGDGNMLKHKEIEWPTIDDLSETTSSVKISNSMTIGQPGDVFNFLLVPQTYEGSKIKLSFSVANSENYSAYLGGENADLTFRPGHRYFFEVTIKENGEITPPKEIGNPEAQMIFALLLRHDHFTLWELLGNYFSEYFEFSSVAELLDGLWHDMDKDVKNAPLENMKALLDKFFPGKKLDGLLDAVGSLEKIELDGNGPKLTADTLDFWIFKNAKKINFAIREKSDAEKEEGGCREIIFDSLNDLEFIDIVGEGSGFYNLTLSNCHNLIQCDLRNKSGLKLNKIDVTNCSPPEGVDFAYIRFSGEQQWGDFTINRHTGTEKIKFEWGYYDVISWYPMEYGAWHPQYTE